MRPDYASSSSNYARERTDDLTPYEPVEDSNPYRHDASLFQNEANMGMSAKSYDGTSRPEYATEYASSYTNSSSGSSTPGVYIRTGEQSPHELDMLWSGSKGLIKEERSPLFFFVLGFVAGSIITGGVFYMLLQKPGLSVGESDLTKPLREGLSIFYKPGSNPNNNNAAEVKTPGATQAGGPSSAASDPQAPIAGMKTYAVEPGDSLGGIAYKFYGSLAPEYIDKIVRANGLSDANAIIHEGQKLTIPPKSY